LLEGKALDRDEFETALDVYYDIMGWNRETGVPSAGKLVELGLGWASPFLEKE
jgi:aldehyde:ferredoxin oxidoreductase